VFSSGKVALSWMNHCSVAVYDCVEDVESVHGHAGKTRLLWLDSLPCQV
jgi:hypothetical protein